jgi:hypothetical protein
MGVQPCSKAALACGNGGGACAAWEDVEQQVEAADLEDLGDHWLQRGKEHATVARLSFLGSEHEAAQAGARDVLERRQIEHQRQASARALGLERLEVGAEGLVIVVVEAAGGGQHARVGVTAVGKGHAIGLRPAPVF